MRVDPTCEFCSVVAGQESTREVFRSRFVVGFLPLEPATLGHTLLIPHAHIPDIWEVDAPTASNLAMATLTLARAIRSALRPDGMNIIQSNGDAATQTVPHVHVHFVPRWYNDSMGAIWPQETHLTEQAKDEACGRIREAVALERQRGAR